VTKVFLTKEEIGHQPPDYGVQWWLTKKREVPYDKQESGHTVAPPLRSDGAE